MTTIWLSIILVGIFTFLTRVSFIVFSEKIKLRSTAQRALRFVPIAVLSAIIIPELLQSGDLRIPFLNPRIIAGTLAAIIAWKTKNILITIITGMFSLFLLN